MKSPKNIIKELEKLVDKRKIDVGEIFDPVEEYRYEPIKHYINSLQIPTKPETASHELFRELVKDVLKRETFNEVSIGRNFVDFTIKESIGNPILIELKPLFKLIKSKGILKPETLNYSDHKNQILKYLKKNEYVILTNLKDAFLFSRNAMIEFEPFSHITFADLLMRFLDYHNLWDTVKRIEDQEIKIDLDKSFFEDLKNWYNEFRDVKIIKNDKFTKEELIVLLLNKIIFIKTLDDFGLIQFNYLAEEYLNKKDKWGAKGSERILTTFFNEVEEYFAYFYDTELFKERFWDYVDKSKENTDKFLNIFETTLGLDAWSKAFGRGMLHYNYRWIDEDIFGKAYETFIAENKKDRGIFYTPKEITKYMADGLVDYLFKPLVEEILKAVDKDVTDYEVADKLLARLYEIKIIDPASGSGSFLIKVLRRIYFYYQKIDRATRWIDTIESENLFDLPDSFKATTEFRQKHNFSNSGQIKLISKIILRHIYAADIDERALETAKTNIWKEAIKLNPLIYNYKKLNGESSHILPDLELNFITGDSLADLTNEKQIEIITEKHKSDIKRLQEIRNKYLQEPFFPEEIDEAIQLKERIFNTLKAELPEIENPIFFCLEYFFTYFNENGEVLKDNEKGFHGVISNPPWEAIKPVEKEFAKKGKYSIDVIEFKKWFEEEIENNKNFADGWKTYRDSYERYNLYLRERYSHQGIGDPNYYKFFMEKNLELIRRNGIMNILIPSGFQTDKGCSELRALVTNKYLLQEISSFENKGYDNIKNSNKIRMKLFPDVHPQFKFSIVKVLNQLSHPFMTFNSKFYMHNPSELYEKEPINYNLEMVKKFSPENFSIMEFRSSRDYEICSEIRAKHKLLKEWGYKLSTEFHMTNASRFFHKVEEVAKIKHNKKMLCLWEGKMIHQYNSNYSKERYIIYENEARISLLETEKRKIKRELKLDDKAIQNLEILLDYQDYRLVYRDVASSTNERTLIASMISPNIFIGNTLNYLIGRNYKLDGGSFNQQQIPKEDLVYLMTLFNSLTLNYYIRNKVSAHASIFFVYELPITNVTKKQREYLVNTGLTLQWLNSEQNQFKKLKKELGVTIDRKADPIKLRAELELFIAKELYGLSDEDWQYITSTFTYGGKTKTREELDKIINYSLKIN